MESLCGLHLVHCLDMYYGMYYFTIKIAVIIFSLTEQPTLQGPMAQATKYLVWTY